MMNRSDTMLRQEPSGQLTPRGSTRSDDRSTSRKEATSRTHLLDLPGEILSQIASHLYLDTQLHFLSLHPTLLSLAQSSYSPLPETIRDILDNPAPYPGVFARLPQLTLFVPQDGGRSFIDVLVRARPRWILENLEYGRWSESVWKEAFERRFLRSWRKYKSPGDSWRAVFLRMLGRLEHRSVGCTHHENWTQFITLHRNGSASINRIYSRTFDPYEIYDEFKHQNNFASQPTHVRVVLHLQDVRIIAIGVLYPEPSIFVNPNAHLALHPPLLRGIAPHPARPTTTTTRQERTTTTPAIDVPTRLPTAAVTPSNNSNEVYFPLVRSISPSGPAHTTYGMGESSTQSTTTLSPSSPSLLSTFARVLPGRTRRLSSAGSDSDDRGGIFRVRSREARDVEGDGGRKRTWSFSRTRSASTIAHGTDSAGPSSHDVQSDQHLPQTTRPLTPAMPSLPELPPQESMSIRPPTPPRTPSPIKRHHFRATMPYSRITKPQPHSAFRDYPNYSPLPGTGLEDAEGRPQRGDRRMLHEEVEDDGLSSLWSTTENAWPDGRKMAEWDPVQSRAVRWVGPMLLVAQIHPSDKDLASPLGAAGHLEGDAPDLGHAGMYASLGYEDLDDLFPWIELRGSGTGGQSRRSGLGFE